MRICRPSIILALFLAATLQLTNQVSCQPVLPTFSYAFCRSELFGNYTANSTYESNLKTVISELAAHASIMPFYDTSVGIGNDTVHGQYYCRGDVSPAFCSDCVSAASLHALNCSNARAAIVWYDECTLRYKNESMFGVTEVAPTLSTYSLANVSDPETLSPVLNETLTQLIQEAVSSGSNSSAKYLATGARELSAFETAYFLVQCSPDLNETQCELCLLHAYDRMHTCCGEWPLAIYTSPPSCQVDYDTRGIFYFTPNGAPPPPPLSSSSSPPPPHVGSEPPPSPQGTVFQFSPPPNRGGSAKTRGSDSVKLWITSTSIAILVFVTLRFNP